MKAITQNKVAEWTFTSQKQYADPFNNVQLDVLFIQDTHRASWGNITVARSTRISPTPYIS